MDELESRTAVSKEPAVIPYAPPDLRRRDWFAAAVWWMPLWCGLIILFAIALGLRDDPFWFAAMGLPLAACVVCAVRGRKALAWYCLGVSLSVTAIGALLPSLL